MNQIYYNYIQKRNEKILQSILTENEIKDLNPGKINLRVHFMFLLSDLLLGLGERIRPEETLVFVRERNLDDSTPLSNCT
jgi:hypothetical protein